MCIVRGKCALKTILPPLLFLLLLLRNGIESRDRSRLGFICIFITLSLCLSLLDDDGDGNGDASIFYREDNNTFVCGGGGEGGGGGNQINCLAPIAQLGLDVELVLAVVSSTE